MCTLIFSDLTQCCLHCIEPQYEPSHFNGPFDLNLVPKCLSTCFLQEKRQEKQSFLNLPKKPETLDIPIYHAIYVSWLSKHMNSRVKQQFLEVFPISSRPENKADFANSSEQWSRTFRRTIFSVKLLFSNTHTVYILVSLFHRTLFTLHCPLT